jgi:NAD-dependent SIR2 family protein deacetylase
MEQQKTFKCPLCNYTTPYTYMLKSHFRSSHKHIKKCPVCGQPINSFYGLANHAARFDDEKHIVLYYILRDSNNSKKNERFFLGRKLLVEFPAILEKHR